MRLRRDRSALAQDRRSAPRRRDAPANAAGCSEVGGKEKIVNKKVKVEKKGKKRNRNEATPCNPCLSGKVFQGEGVARRHDSLGTARYIQAGNAEERKIDRRRYSRPRDAAAKSNLIRFTKACDGVRVRGRVIV